MTRLKIYKRGLTPAELAELLDLLRAAGYVLEDVELVDGVGDPADDCEDDVFLILLTEPLCQDPAFEANLAKVPNGGRRAVCVWPQGGADRVLPSAVDKFSYSLIAWNPDRLRAVLVDDDEVCFETASGASRPAPDTERLECK